MRRFVLIPAVIAAVVLGAAVPAMAADLVGTLVDGACYATKGVKVALAPEHAKCAIACAQKGHRLAIVTTTGEVYVVTGILTDGNNAKLIPLLNRQIVLTGTLGSRVLESTAPLATLTVKSDGRRPTEAVEEVVAKIIKVRKGDFREGDIADVTEMTIDAISIKVAVLGIQ